MPWVTGRETLPALAPDPEWRGRDGALFPTGFWPVGTPGGAQWADGRIEIRVCWVNANGNPVVAAPGEGVTLEPAHKDELVFQGRPRSRISMGAPLTTEGWRAERLALAPRGLVSIRVTGITAVGADHAVIEFWSAS